MSKKQKDDGKKARADTPEEAPKPSKKERFAALEARIEALEQRLDGLGHVVDEAIRSSIAVREKAPEVRTRKRASRAVESGNG